MKILSLEFSVALKLHLEDLLFLIETSGVLMICSIDTNRVWLGLKII